MSQILYILLAILLFGILIFVHEAGHYLSARMFGVKIEEFAIGMGPKILKKVSKKTGILYTLRLFPVGGYVNMGEDDLPEDGRELPPDSFRAKSPIKRFVILASGALMNLILGFIVMAVIVSTSQTLASTTVSYFAEGATSEASGLMLGDRIVKVENADIHVAEELVYEIMYNGYEPIDLTVIRNGEKVVLHDVEFPTDSDSGISYGCRDFGVFPEEKNFVNVARHSFFRSLSTIKMIWQSLVGLVSGRYGVEAVSGPIGITGAITTAAKTGIDNLLYLFVVISMNLGVFNLLPIPALDGGRLLFVVIEMIRRKPVPPKYEAYIHFVGICVLLFIIVLVSVKDIVGIFG